MKLRNRKELATKNRAKRVEIVARTNRTRTHGGGGTPPCSITHHAGWEVRRRRRRHVRYQCTGCLAWGKWERAYQFPDISCGPTQKEVDAEAARVPTREPMPIQTNVVPFVFSDTIAIDPDNEPDSIRFGIIAIGRSGLVGFTIKDLRMMAQKVDLHIPRLARKGTIIDTLVDWASEQ